MKRIFGIALAVAAMFSLAACSNKIEYKTVPYVSFGTFGGDVEETAGSIQVPVLLRNADAADVAITVVPASEFGVGTKETDAVEGVNYSIASPTDGVIKLTKENPESNITLNITDIDGYTGNLNLVIGIESKTDGVQNGANSVILVTITDTDHPLSAMFGDWALVYTAEDWISETETDLYYDEVPFKMSAYDGDPTKVWFSTLLPGGEWYSGYIGVTSVYGEVSEDMSTIRIPVPQAMPKATPGNMFGSYAGQVLKLYSWPGYWDGANPSTEAGYITFTYDEAEGVYFTEDSWGAATDEICEWFYTDFNVITDAAADGEPTYIYKVEE